MVNWQITVNTIFCDAVADEVTIMVYKDWSAKCTGHEKYTGSRDKSVELVKRSMQLRRVVDCQGLGCKLISEYKEKLKAEELKKETAEGKPV